MDYCIALYCTSDWLYQQLMKIKDKDTIADRILDNYNSIRIFKDYIYTESDVGAFSELINSISESEKDEIPIYGEVFFEEKFDEAYHNYETLEIPAKVGLNSPKTVRVIYERLKSIAWDNLKDSYRKIDCNYFNSGNEGKYKERLEEFKKFYKKASLENGAVFSIGGWI